MPHAGWYAGGMTEFSLAQRVYVWLAAVSVACLIVADVVGIKLFRIPLPFELWGVSAIEHTCGMLTFPVTFILTDVINEYYGKKGARRVVYIGVAMAMLVFAVINVAQAMPYLPASYNVSEESFNAVFGSAKIMYVASVSAYLVGQLADVALFGVIKRATGGRLIWLRATGSTVVSQMLDSFVVSYVAFDLGRRIMGEGVPAPFEDIVKIAATGYALKFVLAIAATPVIYALHGMLRRIGLEPVPAGAAA